MVLLSTHNICFSWEIRKIIFSYTLLSRGMKTHLYIIRSIFIMADYVLDHFRPKDAIKAFRKRLNQNMGKNNTAVMYTLTVSYYITNPTNNILIVFCIQSQRNNNFYTTPPPPSPPTLFVVGYTFFMLSVRPSVRNVFFLITWRVIAGFSSNLANMFIYVRQIL